MNSDQPDPFLARCQRTCKRWRCTGRGDTQSYAHRCGFAPPPPPKLCDLYLDELGRRCGAVALDRYLAGWRCEEHMPWSPATSTDTTDDGWDFTITRVPPPEYGTATTDPLGREGDGWHVGRSGLPTRDRGE